MKALHPAPRPYVLAHLLALGHAIRVIVAMTGATGLLGSPTLAALTAAGHEVRALVRPRPGRTLPNRSGVTWVEGNLDHRPALDELVHGADAIVHVAYCPMEESPPAGKTAAQHFLDTNVGGTLALIERTFATAAKQLVFVSSLAVYGTQSHLAEAAARQPIDEDFPVWPREFYGAHKAALEKMVIAGSGDAGLNTSAFRIGCVLGDYPDRQRDHLATVADEIAAHEEIRTQLGAYVITAEDAASLLAATVGDATVAGGVYNAFDRWLDFGSLASVAEEILGRPVRVVCDPAPEPQPPILNYRLGDRAPRWNTDTRLRELLAARIQEAR